jgi:hypothetical protein
MNGKNWKGLGVSAALMAACAGADARGAACEIEQRLAPLPAGLDESSGVAASRTMPGVFWTLNDSGGDPVVTAVRSDGSGVANVKIEGARNRDWEDIAVGPCEGGSCLYIGDTGDNDGKHESVDLYRTPEPRTGQEAVTAERFSMRYPDGSRDAESLFVLPSGQPYLVSKGRDGTSVALYRYPLPLRSGETVTLEKVAEIEPARERKGMELVTDASASPSGKWIAVRSYKALRIFRADALLRGDVQPEQVVDLTPVGEPQGEGVAIFDDGRVVLTSEGAVKDNPATISVLRCPLP